VTPLTLFMFKRCYDFTLTTTNTPARRPSPARATNIKKALATFKQQGKTLGTPENLNYDAQIDGALANKSAAIDAYSEVAGIAEALRKEGLSLAKIAEHLNILGYRTRGNSEFAAMTIKRLLNQVKVP